MVYAETDARETGYLRTTVLDQFRSDEWRPSPRDLPSDNSADGRFPTPPGLGRRRGRPDRGLEAAARPRLRHHLAPAALPDRGARRSQGNWRYDSRTLDVAYVGGSLAPGAELRGHVAHPRHHRQAARRRASPTRPGCGPTMTARARRPARRGQDPGQGGDRGRHDRVPEGARPAGLVPQRRRVHLLPGAAQRFGDGPARRLHHRRPGRLLRAVRGRHGGDGPRPEHPLPGGRGLPRRRPQQPDGRILYTSDDRHAWPEMYFSGVGWVRFEPTPGQRAGATPSWTRQDLDDPGPDDGPERCGEPSARAPVRDGATADSAELRRRWRLGPVVAVRGPAVLVLLAGIGPGVVRRTQRRRRLGGERPGAPRRGRLGRAARHRAGPRPGVARPAITARAGAKRRGPGAPRDRRGRVAGGAAGAGRAGPLRPGRRRTVRCSRSTRRCARTPSRPSSRGAR